MVLDALRLSGPRLPPIRLINRANGRSVDVESALLDTGASTTVIDHALAEALDLLSERTVLHTGVAVALRRAIVLRRLDVVFFGDGGHSIVTLDDAIAMPDMQRSAATRVLLGRDLLARCEMTYSGPNERVELRFA